MINEYMRKKSEGLNLGEKIMEHLNAIKDKDLVHLIDNAFFSAESDRGVEFQVRRTNLFRDKRVLHIVDEIEEREKMQRAIEEAEAKKDMTYEEFLVRYGDMIEGKSSHKEERYSSHSRPVTGHKDADIDGKSEAGKSDMKRSQANKSAMSKGSGKSSMNNTKEGFDVKDDLKFDIPDTCFLILTKGNKISKMEKKFKLLAHPYPLLEGEMILF
jgi:hypothetical protein